MVAVRHAWVRRCYPAVILQNNGLETTSTVPEAWDGAEIAEEQRTSVAGSDAARAAAAAALCRQAVALGASYVLLYRRELYAGTTPQGLDACRAAMAAKV
jgi:hypothetical protein